jgi:hypothetical protein
MLWEGLSALLVLCRRKTNDICSPCSPERKSVPQQDDDIFHSARREPMEQSAGKLGRVDNGVL